MAILCNNCTKVQMCAQCRAAMQNQQATWWKHLVPIAYDPFAWTTVTTTTTTTTPVKTVIEEQDDTRVC